MKCRKVCLICLVCLLTACNAVPEAYEEGHTYLLFLRTAPDGITNMVMHQGSVEIMVSDTALYDAQSTAYACVPLYNERIYQELHSVNDISQSVQEAD